MVSAFWWQKVSVTSLERHQVWWYLGAVVAGFGSARAFPHFGEGLELMIWALLVVLLFATFSQLSLRTLPRALADRRFLLAALVGNFVIVPLVVWALVQFLPADDALLLGMLLVLLVPCTDWFITFTALGGGDAVRATAWTPIALVLQLALLPVYLWLFTDTDVGSTLRFASIWPAILVVAVPLLVALGTQPWFNHSESGRRCRAGLAWVPVPVLTIVLALVTISHAGAAQDAGVVLLPVVGVAIAYLAFALAIAWGLGRILGLHTAEGRTLAFGLGTRNSFVVLPVALSLPAGWELVAVVIVTQSLVELFGMVLYLWVVPRYVFPATPQ